MIKVSLVVLILIAAMIPGQLESAPYEEIDILVILVQINLTEDELANASEAVRALETKVYDYSDGMATTNVDLLFYKGDLPYIVTQNGDMFPDDVRLSLWNDGHKYDYVGTILSPSLVPYYEKGVRGMANVTGADSFWVAADNKASRVVLHELAHVIEADKVQAGYTNFPQCEENTRPGAGVHCAIDYGYSGASSDDWMDDYYSGDIRDGTGLTEEGWRAG